MKNSEKKKITLYYAITDYLLEKKEKADKINVITAVGVSMRPTLLSGDKIAVKKIPQDQFSQEDIIAFVNNNLVVCHRIVKIIKENNQTLFITQGDAVKNPDKTKIIPEQVAGKIVYVIRQGKKINPYSGVCYEDKLLLKTRLKMFFLSLSKNLFLWFKAGLKSILKFFRIYLFFKKKYFVMIKNKIKYQLQLPRKTLKYPLYRYATIPWPEVEGRPDDFYQPLKQIGGFKLTASRNQNKEAEVKIAKFINPKSKKTFWVIINLFFDRLFTEIDKEDEFLSKAYFILGKIGVKKLYALAPEKEIFFNRSFCQYITKSKPKFIRKIRNKKLYLLGDAK